MDNFNCLKATIEDFPTDLKPKCSYSLEILADGQSVASTKSMAFQDKVYLEFESHFTYDDFLGAEIRAHLVIYCTNSVSCSSSSAALAAKPSWFAVSDLLQDPTFADFTFIVKGKEFKLHKNILSLGSSVMRKMFLANFDEAHDNKCNVDHIEPDIFELLIRFIYCGEVPVNLIEVANPLFEAAHYFEVDPLKKICVELFKWNLTTQNSVDTFSMACLYDLEELKMLSWLIVKR
jgi:BTB/POZ domain